MGGFAYGCVLFPFLEDGVVEVPDTFLPFDGREISWYSRPSDDLWVVILVKNWFCVRLDVHEVNPVYFIVIFVLLILKFLES
jgi:hypothetical protein